MQPDKDMPLDIIVSFPHSVLSAGGWAETPENNKRGRMRTIMVEISRFKINKVLVKISRLQQVSAASLCSVDSYAAKLKFPVIHCCYQVGGS